MSNVNGLQVGGDNSNTDWNNKNSKSVRNHTVLLSLMCFTAPLIRNSVCPNPFCLVSVRIRRNPRVDCLADHSPPTKNRRVRPAMECEWGHLTPWREKSTFQPGRSSEAPTSAVQPNINTHQNQQWCDFTKRHKHSLKNTPHVSQGWCSVSTRHFLCQQKFTWNVQGNF